MANRCESNGNSETLFFWVAKSLQMVTAAIKWKDAWSLEEKRWYPRQHIKKHRHYFANNGPSTQSYGISSSRVWMWELDYKESWVPKNWWFWTVVLERTLESPLDCKEIQPVHPRGNQSWIFSHSWVDTHTTERASKKFSTDPLPTLSLTTFLGERPLLLP